MAENPFTIDHILSVQRPTMFTPMHLSPDGRWLALSVQGRKRTEEVPHKDGFTAHGVPAGATGSYILVVDTTTGHTLRPFPEDSTSWTGRWSPDGSLLAAYVQQEDMVCLGIWSLKTYEFR